MTMFPSNWIKSIVLIGCIFMSYPFFAFASEATEVPQTSEPIGIENQSEVIRIKSQKRSELEERKVSLERENSTLTVEIQDLEKSIADTKVEITSIEDSLSSIDEILEQSEESDPETLESRNQRRSALNNQLDEAKLLLVELTQELESKRQKQNSNIETLAIINEALIETREEVRAERGAFVRIIWRGVSDNSGYIFLIVAIIVIYLIARKITYRVLPNQSAFLWGDIILRSIAILLIFMVFLYAFADRIVGIITLFSVFSAALVVALQDFVSSFFAWLYIRGKNKYRVGDVIRVSGTNGYFFGRVKRIEILRTILDESVGDSNPQQSIDKERPTGRVVSFPNNVIMRDALVNFTQNHRTMWQSVDITITFESDWQLAERELRKVVDKIFSQEWYKEHKIERSYIPKVHISIADDGVRFSVWFPARIGEYRETLESVSRAILIAFKKKKIDLAYKSFAIYQK